MLILAGVSLNAIVGDNGIITQAQNTDIRSGMVAFEEWLQEEYANNYEKIDDTDGNKISALNKALNYTLLLKEGSRDYIINEGKVYYLLDKSCSYIPKEIRDGLLRGDTTDYVKYSRLEDVYGITKDLKLYYCNNGIEGVYGNFENYDIDPHAPATGINNNSNLKTAMTGILSSKYGVTVDEETGVTLTNISILKDLELDGNTYSGITDITGLGDLKNLKTLTLSNLNLTSLNGIEGITNLYYLYLKNTTVGDFTALTSVINLQYLYLYLPNTINEEIANGQVTLLGKGLKKADKLTKLEYFGIFGYDIANNNSDIQRFISNGAGYPEYGKSNLTSLKGIELLNNSIKNSIRFMYLNNNSITSCEEILTFRKVNTLWLICNETLTSLNGVPDSVVILYAQYCGLSDLIGIENCKSLEKLIVNSNNNLQSLSGIENLTNLGKLYANNCNLKNISFLSGNENKGMISLFYLSATNNVNLKDVTAISLCLRISTLYLADNLNMTDDSVRTLEDTIERCGSNYSIPNKYQKLFLKNPSPDFSSQGLTDYSIEISSLKGRTNVTWLRLDSNTSLGSSKLSKLKADGKITNDDLNKMLVNLSLSDAEKVIVNNAIASSSELSGESNNNIYFRYILSTLTQLKALNLNYISNLDKMDWVLKMPTLIQLCITGTGISDVSNLSTFSNLRSLEVSNPNTNLSTIQNIIESELWNNGYPLSTSVSNGSGWNNSFYCGLLIGNRWNFKYV